MRIESAGWTHVGRRSHNEDAWEARPELGLFVVAAGLARGSAVEVAERLVEAAYAAGGRDNITALVVGVAE